MEEAARRGLRLPKVEPFAEYRNDPLFYAVNVLGQSWWQKQSEIALALLAHKKVAVKASHSVGKSHIGAGLVNWWYDCFDPGLCLTTANTRAQVEDVLWARVREQRKGRPGLQPKAPRMESSETHFAVGYTATTADAFQGRHEEKLFILFDEADGIDGQFFDAAEGMATGPENRWLCIYNPVGSGTRMEMEEDTGDWHIITISALEHPNILAQLQGLPMPYPKAVSLEWVEDKIKRWCSPVTLHPKATDVEWPPGSGLRHRPGPLFESRVLGQRASQGIDTVWSDAAWQACLIEQPIPDEPVKIGCDVARFGDDNTVIYARRGPCLLHHEAHNGWGTNETTGRLKELCRQFGSHSGQEPKKVEVFVDDDGIGGAVTDNRDGYAFLPCSGASRAHQADDYPNRRSEVWFAGAGKAEEGLIDVTRLPADIQQELRRELKAVKYATDSQGRRVVEKKADTKKRLKRSPDEADAFNLCVLGGKTTPAWTFS